MKSTLDRLSPAGRLYLFLFCTLSGGVIAYISLITLTPRGVLGLYISQAGTGDTSKTTLPSPTPVPREPTVVQAQPTTPPAVAQPTPTQTPQTSQPSTAPPSNEISTGQEPLLQTPIYVVTKDEGELIDISRPSVDVEYQPTFSAVIVKAIEYASQATITVNPTTTASVTSAPGSSPQNGSAQQPVQTTQNSTKMVQSTDQIIITTPTIVRQVELADSSVGEITDVLRPYRIVVKPVGTSTISISRSGITAFTQLPVRINLNRTAVFLITPDGKANVVYYPDVIVEFAQDTNLLTRVDQPSSSADQPMKLSFIDGDLVYDIRGCSQQYLFAFLPICIKRTVRISARSKNIYSITHPRFDQILDILSV